MKYVVTASQMKQYDQNTIEKIGIPGLVLMERAALATFDYIEKLGRAGSIKLGRVLVLCGNGNNGGDGAVLARLMCESGSKVVVWRPSANGKMSESMARQMDILQQYPVDIIEEFPEAEAIGEVGKKLPNCEFDIIVDALFGVGLCRDIEGVMAAAIEKANAMSGYKIAIDIPSGINADDGQVMGCVFKADATVTYGFTKRGLHLFPGCEYAGEVEIATMGISEAAFFGHEPDMYMFDEPISELLPIRQPDGNKGTFGKALIIAGSMNMAGAAIMAARACYRIGAGMVKVLTVPENRELLQVALPEALLGNYDDFDSSEKWADVICAGPGLGKSKEAHEILKKAICDSNKPILIDADGLNILSEDSGIEFRKHLAECTAYSDASSQSDVRRQVILTPHVGELARLVGEPIASVKVKLLDYGRKLSKELGCIVVAKDARTFVINGDEPVCLNVRGCSGMAVAGSGDVLAGIITGLMAQKLENAAAVGVYVHAIAGESASKRVGEYGCMPSDCIDELDGKR